MCLLLRAVTGNSTKKSIETNSMGSTRKFSYSHPPWVLMLWFNYCTNFTIRNEINKILIQARPPKEPPGCVYEF